MKKHDSDTIAAIATPAGMGGVGVIRLSGSAALAIAHRITGKTLTPRYAHYATFRDADNRQLDQGLVIYFNAPHSYTGEDVVEFQGHGGVYIMQSLLQAILSQGARQAQPGEFTERAFLNDKLDLVQAEAVADLIESRSRTAVTAALRSLSGQFSAVIDELQAQVIALRVYIEAALDFSDEEIDFLSEGNIKAQVADLRAHVDKTLAMADYGQLLNAGLNVVLVGEPNAGKSSLMNCLLGHERAIVTEEAGTTRDTLAETITLKGVPINITDTAGLRETDNRVEKVGIERAKAAIQSADLAIWLRQAQQLDDEKPSILAGVDVIEVHNKSDLLENVPSHSAQVLHISAKQHSGIDALLEAIAEKISGKHTEEGVFSARQRHVQALKQTQTHVETAYQLMQAGQTPELVAEELRLAQQALSEITGQYHSDDLLGAIFSSFCIGK